MRSLLEVVKAVADAVRAEDNERHGRRVAYWWNISRWPKIRRRIEAEFSAINGPLADTLAANGLDEGWLRRSYLDIGKSSRSTVLAGGPHIDAESLPSWLAMPGHP